MKRICLFTAEWCTACPQARINLMKGIREAGQDMSILTTYSMTKADARAEAMRHGVRNLPTVNLMTGSDIVESMVGVRSEYEYASKIRHWMES